MLLRYKHFRNNNNNKFIQSPNIQCSASDYAYSSVDHALVSEFLDNYESCFLYNEH